MDTKYYYRVHWVNSPCFCAEHAYSSIWEADKTLDNSRVRCVTAGSHYFSACFDLDCRSCGGCGWVSAARGYSCFESLQELVEYFGDRGGLHSNDVKVIKFTGEVTGTGVDGEPLVVPEQIIFSRPWARAVKYINKIEGLFFDMDFYFTKPTNFNALQYCKACRNSKETCACASYWRAAIMHKIGFVHEWEDFI